MYDLKTNDGSRKSIILAKKSQRPAVAVFECIIMRQSRAPRKLPKISAASWDFISTE